MKEKQGRDIFTVRGISCAPAGIEVFKKGRKRNWVGRGALRDEASNNFFLVSSYRRVSSTEYRIPDNSRRVRGGQKSVEPSVKLKHTRAELVFLLYSHSHVHGKRPFSVLSGRLGPSRPVGSPSILL